MWMFHFVWSSDSICTWSSIYRFIYHTYLLFLPWLLYWVIDITSYVILCFTYLINSKKIWVLCNALEEKNLPLGFEIEIYVDVDSSSSAIKHRLTTSSLASQDSFSSHKSQPFLATRIRPLESFRTFPYEVTGLFTLHTHHLLPLDFVLFFFGCKYYC